MQSPATEAAAILILMRWGGPGQDDGVAMKPSVNPLHLEFDCRIHVLSSLLQHLGA